MARLSDEQISSALKDLPGWSRNGNAMEKLFGFPDFASAMIFVNKTAELAEEATHHPDIDIRYNRVKISLTSHDSGGITGRDVKLAKRIAAL